MELVKTPFYDYGEDPVPVTEHITEQEYSPSTSSE
jgi:hypothetical protein